MTCDYNKTFPGEVKLCSMESRTPFIAQICVRTRKNKLAIAKMLSSTGTKHALWSGFWKKHTSDVLKLANTLCGSNYKWEDRPSVGKRARWDTAFSLARAEILLKTKWIDEGNFTWEDFDN